MGIYGPDELRPGDAVDTEVREDCTVFRLSNAGGTGTITEYEVFRGVGVLFNDMHMYDFTEGGAGSCALIVEYCLQGRFEAAFRDGRRFYIGAGDVCLHNMEYEELSACSMPVRHYHGVSLAVCTESDALFSSMLAAAEVDFAGLAEGTRARGGVRVFRAGEELARAFAALYAARQAGRGRMRLALLGIFSLLAEISGEGERARFCSLPKDIAAILKRAELYLWENLFGRLTIEELSSRFGMSATSFKNYFRVLYGMPVHRYIRICRMQVAAKELVETEHKISDIARRAGYRSESKFSAAFAAFSGFAPRDYRRRGILSDWAINAPVRV